MKLIETKALATDVTAHDVSPQTVNTDPAAYSRLGWLIVVVGVIGFLLWATLAPLDKGVPMSGNVAKEGNRKAIQYQNGGTVERILVKEGDQVKKGQVLVRMNSVNVTAQSEVSRAQLMAQLATEARLLAERDAKSAPVKTPEMAAYLNDAQFQEGLQQQAQLLATRQGSLASELAAAEESIAGLKMQIEGLKASRESKQLQFNILKEQVVNLRELARDGYVARARLLDVERTLAQVEGGIAEDTANIGRGQRQIAELTLKRTQRNQDYQKEVRAQLAEVQRDARALAARLVAETYAVGSVDVKSPVDGVVIGMAVFTEGGVVQPGFRMMDVVPLKDELIVEGRLPVNLVDKVHEGLPVELMFSAFNSNTTPHIKGVVKLVSSDRLLDERNGMPYYNVHAQVLPEGIKLMQAKHMNIRPGMPVEMFVKTGERSMMSYLLKPVFDRAKSSMSEE